MNREQYEALLADALGDELTPGDRVVFERCLDEHPDWRREYESARGTLDTLVRVTAPPRVIVRREGYRLIFESAEVPAPTSTPTTAGAWHRYAAAILLAFTAGYAAHATLLLKDAVRPTHEIVHAPVPNPTGAAPQRPEARTPTRGTSFRTALIDAHRRNPARSDLANCLIAMSGRR